VGTPVRPIGRSAEKKGGKKGEKRGENPVKTMITENPAKVGATVRLMRRRRQKKRGKRGGGKGEKKKYGLQKTCKSGRSGQAHEMMERKKNPPLRALLAVASSMATL